MKRSISDHFRFDQLINSRADDGKSLTTINNIKVQKYKKILAPTQHLYLSLSLWAPGRPTALYVRSAVICLGLHGYYRTRGNTSLRVHCILRTRAAALSCSALVLGTLVHYHIELAAGSRNEYCASYLTEVIGKSLSAPMLTGSSRPAGLGRTVIDRGD